MFVLIKIYMIVGDHVSLGPRTRYTWPLFFILVRKHMTVGTYAFLLKEHVALSNWFVFAVTVGGQVHTIHS